MAVGQEAAPRLMALMKAHRSWVGRFARPELLLLAGLLLIYNLNLRQVSSFDTFASRFVAISVLSDGDLALDELFPELADAPANDEWPDYFIRSRGRIYDSHPPIGPLLALPVYVLPVWLGIPSEPYQVANVSSKVAASLMAALSAVVVFATVRRVLRIVRMSDRDTTAASSRTSATTRETRVALFAALAYALGTPVWSTASQAMWSHTPAVLGYAVALWGLVAGWPILGGAGAAAAVLARPATAPAALLLMAYVVHRAWRRGGLDARGARRVWASAAARFGASATVIGGLGLGYNLWLFGNLVGGAPLRTQYWIDQLGTPNMFAGSLLNGLAGLTVSPSRGLIVFSPILVVAFVGCVGVWKARPKGSDQTGGERSDAWLLGRYATLAALAILLTYAKFIVWWGGHGYGPRYLADAMPFFGLLLGFGLYPFVDRNWLVAWKGHATMTAAVLLLASSVFIQAVGAFCWPSTWTLGDPPYAQRLWNWRDSQIVVCIRSGPLFDPMAQRLFVRLGLAKVS